MRPTKPRVTVVMAVHNGAQHLWRAVSSIRRQTEPNFEVIIIDDGSTDSTPEILERIKDKRFRHISLKENWGISWARNIGIMNAESDLIMIMDSDDQMAPDRIGLQTTFMDQNPKITFSGTNVIKRVGKKNIPMKYDGIDGNIKAKLLLVNGGAMIDPSTCFRKAFIRDNFINYPPMRTDMDHALWLHATKAGGSFGIVPSYLLLYRRHSGNITSETAPHYHQMIKDKINVRTQVLMAYFPELTQTDAQSVARLFDARRIKGNAGLKRGLDTARHCTQYNVSMYGENKNLVNQMLAQAINSAEGLRRHT